MKHRAVSLRQLSILFRLSTQLVNLWLEVYALDLVLFLVVTGKIKQLTDMVLGLSNEKKNVLTQMIFTRRC